MSEIDDLLAPPAAPERVTVLDVVRQDIDILAEKKRAFQHAFGSPAGQAVLDDFRSFCRADRTCFHADPRLHAVLEGRREVWLRIQEYLDLSPEELFARKTGNVHVPKL